jgi:hypothetical protein
LPPGIPAVLVHRIGALPEGLRAINYEDADRVEILAGSSEGYADEVIE